MHAPRRRFPHGLLAALLAGCTPPPTPAPPIPVAVTDPCRVGTAPSGASDTVRVALPEAVAARAIPTPATDAEHLVFRQLYEQLVRIDCTDSVRPALATAWHSADGGRQWAFALRPGARFWDGTPVDAAALRTAWRADTALPVADVRPADDATVVVVLVLPRPLAAFADPAWSVVKRIPESPWPLGTGPVWVDAWTTEGGDSLLRAAPVPGAPAGTPTIEFRRGRTTDPRDPIDRAIDVVVTRDPTVQRYALGRTDWTAVALPWDRLYALVSPARTRAALATELGAEARATLARDAVRAEARAPAEPAWWSAAPCRADGPTGRAGTAFRNQVAFPRADAVARDLADRLVARADAELAALTGASDTEVRSVALDPMGWSATLRSGTALALVLPLPRRPLDRCRAVGQLIAAAPWLADSAGALPAAALVSLVETRATVLLRSGTSAQLDGDGGIRLVPRAGDRTP